MKHDPSHVARSAFRRQTHPGCFVCGPANGHGLGLEFRLGEGGVVEASFACQGAFEGYPATLHGGIICALLDGAMTNCLFAHGHAAVTAELKVRFRHPVMTERPARVRGLDRLVLAAIARTGGRTRAGRTDHGDGAG